MGTRHLNPSAALKNLTRYFQMNLFLCPHGNVNGPRGQELGAVYDTKVINTEVALYSKHIIVTVPYFHLFDCYCSSPCGDLLSL